MRRYVLILSLALFVTAFLAGCTSSGGGNDDQSDLPSLAGVWQPASGEAVFPSSSLGSLQYLEFAGSSGTSGQGRVYGLHEDTGVLACADFVFAAVAPDVVSLSSGDLLSGTELFVYERTDGDTLVLTDEDGNSRAFVATSSVPQSSICETATFIDSFEDIALDLSNFGTMASDGVYLWVSGDDGFVYPVRPMDGQLGMGIDLGTTYDEILVMQGGDFWGHCGCGNVAIVARTQPGGGQIDLVTTDVDLGLELSVRAGAFDGAHLWLAGYSFDLGTYLIFQVDAEAEPDVRVNSLTFDRNIITMTVHDGALWALVEALGPKLIQIDPDLAQATRTIELPDLTDGWYRGIASLGGKLYLLVESDSRNSFDIHSVDP